MNPLNSYDTLILEGGSLRCAFTAGVMDALMLLGPLKFDRMFGISAGSMVMATYLSGQYKHFTGFLVSWSKTASSSGSPRHGRRKG